MPRIARKKSVSGVYHIIVRGANRQEIFHDEEDRIKFLDSLGKYKRRTGIKLYAWCLMGNHVHLLLREGTESISVTMQRLGVSYALYYNWKYMTTGHLFQNRFMSEAVEDTSYLLTVTRYIHQNPVKARIVTLPDEWPWSSCRVYYGSLEYPQDLLDPHYILNMFSTDPSLASSRFKTFNENTTGDACLEAPEQLRRRLTDDEARIEIRKCLGIFEIPQIKSMPREQRTEVLRRVKKIEGLSQRQAARILGISANLVFKA
jgi:putative transposase